jgi:hypothetical protein
MKLLPSVLAHQHKVLEIFALAVQHGGSFTEEQFDTAFPNLILPPKDHQSPLEIALGITIPKFFGPGVPGHALFLTEQPYLQLLIAMVHCKLLRKRGKTYSIIH